MTGEPTPRRAWRHLRPHLPLLLAAGLYVLSRLLVVLSAGDLVHPVMDQEAKHTELLWAMSSGRFGEGGWQLFDFLLTAGSLHHPGYLSVSAFYAVLAVPFGPTLLAVRLVPVLCWAVGLSAVGWLVGRRLGRWAGVAVPLLACFAPPDVLAKQLAAVGSHVECVGPLGVALAGWLAWLDQESSWRRAAFAGVALGYAAAFDYLLGPAILGLVLLAVLPPWRRPTRRELGALAVGGLVGLWPLWLVMAPDPAGLFQRSITEDPNSTLLNVATGSGRGWFEYRRAFFWALGLEWQELGIFAPGGAEATSEGGRHLVKALVVLGPLLLLPAALLSRHRRLGLAFALLPVSVLVGIVVTSPFDFVRLAYVMPVWFLGVAWPAVGLGLGWALWRGEGRGLRAVGAATGLLAVLGAATLVALTAADEARMVRLSRAGELLDYRYAAYWHYRIDTITADEVERTNDLIDVLEAEGEPWGAITAGLGFPGGEGDLEVGADGPWEAPKPSWPGLRARFEGWDEWTNTYRSSQPEAWEAMDPERAGAVMGRAMAIRADGDGALAASLLERARAEEMWPAELAESGFWRGWGFSLGRYEAGDDWLAQVPEEHREQARAGAEAGRARGDVPEVLRRPTVNTVLSGPT